MMTIILDRDRRSGKLTISETVYLIAWLLDLCR